MKVSKTGYKKTSKDKNKKSLIVPSGRITMTENDGKPLEKGPILGIDNLGNITMMQPGLDYSFPGSYVYEIPMAEQGYAVPGRYRNPEGNWVSVYANGGDISIPDLSRPNFKYGGWLDKYQDGSEVTQMGPELNPVNVSAEKPNAIKRAWNNFERSKYNPLNLFIDDMSSIDEASAFDVARQMGRPNYMYNGKRYSTKMDWLTQQEQLEQTGITDDQLHRRGFFEKRLSNNLEPLGYGMGDQSQFDRFWNAAIKNEKDPEKALRDLGIEDPDTGEIYGRNRTDAYNLYTGLPQKYNTFSISKYKPSRAKDSDVVYYSINDLANNKDFKRHVVEDYKTSKSTIDRIAKEKGWSNDKLDYLKKRYDIQYDRGRVNEGLNPGEGLNDNNLDYIFSRTFYGDSDVSRTDKGKLKAFFKDIGETDLANNIDQVIKSSKDLGMDSPYFHKLVDISNDIIGQLGAYDPKTASFNFTDGYAGVMGNYNLSKGVDPETGREYVSYRDKWDIDPVDFGKPFEVYDRIYFDDPDLIVPQQKYGGWLDRYQEGKQVNQPVNATWSNEFGTYMLPEATVKPSISPAATQAILNREANMAIAPAPSAFDRRVAQAQYIMSNPFDAFGNYVRQGYVPQGNLGNYGMREKSSPIGQLLMDFNPYNWANAAYRASIRGGDPDTYTTLSGAGNMGADLLEALPVTAAFNPLYKEAASLAKTVGKNVKNLPKTTKNELMAQYMSRALDKTNLPAYSERQVLTPRIDPINRSSVNVKNDLFQEYGDEGYKQLIEDLYNHYRGAYEMPLVEFKSSKPSSFFTNVGSGEDAVQGKLFKEKFCLPGSECAKTSNAITNKTFTEITGLPFAAQENAHNAWHLEDQMTRHGAKNVTEELAQGQVPKVGDRVLMGNDIDQSTFVPGYTADPEVRHAGFVAGYHPNSQGNLVPMILESGKDSPVFLNPISHTFTGPNSVKQVIRPRQFLDDTFGKGLVDKNIRYAYRDKPSVAEYSSQNETVQSLLNEAQQHREPIKRMHDLTNDEFDELLNSLIGIGAQETKLNATLPSGSLPAAKIKLQNTLADMGLTGPVKQTINLAKKTANALTSKSSSLPKYPGTSFIEMESAKLANAEGIPFSEALRTIKSQYQPKPKFIPSTVEPSKGMFRQKFKTENARTSDFEHHITNDELGHGLSQMAENFSKIKKLYPDATPRQLIDLTTLMWNSPGKAQNKQLVDFYLLGKGNPNPAKFKFDYLNKVNKYRDELINVHPQSLDPYREIFRAGYPEIQYKKGGWLDSYQDGGGKINYTYSDEFGTMLPEVNVTGEQPIQYKVPKPLPSGAISSVPFFEAALMAPTALATITPWLSAPATIGSTVYPSITLGNVLGATGAGISTNEFFNPESHTRASVNRAYENPTRDNVIDAVSNVGLAGLGYVGVGMGKGVKDAGKYLTTKTPVKNTWKLLPEGTFQDYSKLRTPDKSYRVAGMDAYEDFVSSGKLRSVTPMPTPGMSFAEKMQQRPTAFPSFQKGYADLRYLPEEGGVVFETSLPTFRRGDLNPVTGLQIKGRHYAHRVIDPETGATLGSVPAKDVNVYESTPNWLKGYKQINKSNSDRITGPGPLMLGLSKYTHEVKNPAYFQKMLDSYSTNKLSNQSKQYFQGIIKSVEKQGGLATRKQYDMLQRLRTGDFNYGKKEYGGSLDMYQDGNQVDIQKDPQIISQQNQKYQDAIKWHEDWMNSPMYKQMLYEGTDYSKFPSVSNLAAGDFDFDSDDWGRVHNYDPNLIDAQRRESLSNLKKTPLRISNWEASGAGGMYDPRSKDISVYPIGYNEPGLMEHEVRHAMDTQHYLIPNNPGEPMYSSYKGIPKKDTDYLKAIRDRKFEDSPMFGKITNEDEMDDWYGNRSYIQTPTEVNARLAEIRKQAQEQKVYDPFTQPIPTDFFKNFDSRALKELKNYYKEEEIQHMLNNFSYNNNQNNPTGIYQSKLGGSTKWLDKYQTKGEVTTPANFLWIDDQGQFRDFPIQVPPPRSFEQKVDDFLGNPQEKARKLSNTSIGPFEDQVDNLRHPAAAMYTTEALGSSLGAAMAANALGAAHEISVLPQTIKSDGWYHGLMSTAEDLFNNAVGTGVGMIPFLPTESKESLLMYLSDNNKLPDGVSMAKGDMYWKKKDGGQSQGDGYYDYIKGKGSNAYSIFAKGGSKGWLDNYK